MSVTVETGTTLPFERFWSWLRRHANCIVRAGASDAYLYDQEAFHWNLDEDEERNPIVQLVWGKLLVSELVLDLRDVLYVEATPDESGDPGQYVFDVVAGSRDGPHAVYHFLLAHAFEEEAQHKRGLKH